MGMSFTMSFEEYETWIDDYKAKRLQKAKEQLEEAIEQGDQARITRLLDKIDYIQNCTF